LGRIYANRLCGVYLFGSYARQEQDSESDLDILIVLADINRYSEEIKRTSDITSRLSLKYYVSISRVFIKEVDWQSADTSLLRDAREEAVPAGNPKHVEVWCEDAEKRREAQRKTFFKYSPCSPRSCGVDYFVFIYVDLFELDYARRSADP
jgi:predicted nucleotidyltransferase